MTPGELVRIEQLKGTGLNHAQAVAALRAEQLAQADMGACPSCQRPTYANLSFCGHCGAKLETLGGGGSATEGDWGSAANEGANRSCPNCGVANLSGQVFCGSCGAVLYRGQGGPRQLSAQTTKTGYGPLHVFGALCVAGAVAIGLSEAFDLATAESARRAEADAAGQRRQAELARLPSLVQEVSDAVKSQNWEVGAAGYREALRIDPKSVEPLATEWAKIEPAFLEIETRRAQQAYTTRVEAAITEAERVATDKELCDTLSRVADAWKELKIATKEDKLLYRRAQNAAIRLERCRKLMIRHVEEGVRKVMIAQRRSSKEVFDRLFLESNMDVEISVSGANADTITLTHVFFDSRVWMHKFEEAGLFLHLQKIGFKKVYFRTGFDGGWDYTLHPEPETNIAPPATMVELGLGKALEL